MAVRKFEITTRRQDLINITHFVSEAVRESGITEGVCTVFCPHTTAAITINENADPDVVHDLLLGFDAAFPDRPDFLHAEGNSAAHLKASTVGASENIIITEGRLLLGIWQGIYFCEFDGPRSRSFYVYIA
ncbi:MAG TPA: YjbQ family protein [Treponema sp.]|nr:YjbQ family protein [Treponema sp.]